MWGYKIQVYCNNLVLKQSPQWWALLKLLNSSFSCVRITIFSYTKIHGKRVILRSPFHYKLVKLNTYSSNFQVIISISWCSYFSIFFFKKLLNKLVSYSSHIKIKYKYIPSTKCK